MTTRTVTTQTDLDAALADASIDVIHIESPRGVWLRLRASKHTSADGYRKKGGRGCDWVAYGLFRGPWEVVVAGEGDKPERSIWSFPLATVGAES